VQPCWLPQPLHSKSAEVYSKVQKRANAGGIFILSKLNGNPCPCSDVFKAVIRALAEDASDQQVQEVHTVQTLAAESFYSCFVSLNFMQIKEATVAELMKLIYV